MRLALRLGCGLDELERWPAARLAAYRALSILDDWDGRRQKRLLAEVHNLLLRWLRATGSDVPDYLWSDERDYDFDGRPDRRAEMQQHRDADSLDPAAYKGRF